MDFQKWPRPMMISDKGGGSPESEEKISYEQAKNIRGGTLILQKQYSEEGWRRMVDEGLPTASDEVKQAMYQSGLPGRIPNHLLRLLSRQGAEYDFGVALLEHGPQYFKENKDLHWTANHIVSSEFSDTVMWWTLAPYLYVNLIENGISQKDAIRKVIDWATTSQVLSNDKDIAYQAEEKQTLEGLEVLEKAGVGRYGLSHIPDDLSHRFARQEARRIALEVFGIEEAKK